MTIETMLIIAAVWLLVSNVVSCAAALKMYKSDEEKLIERHEYIIALPFLTLFFICISPLIVVVFILRGIYEVLKALWMLLTKRPVFS